MASSIETTSTTTTLKNNGNTYLSVDTNDDVAITNTLTATSPTFVTPALGTPASGVVTNLTGTASININGTVGATTPAAATVTSLNGGQLAGNRNKIINGDMRINQRHGTSTITLGSAATNTFVADRTRAFKGTSGGVMTGRKADASTLGGFYDCFEVKTTTAATASSGDINAIWQAVEGFNFSDMSFGTANAKSFTLSFWMHANTAGSYGVSFLGNMAQSNRSYTTAVTVSAGQANSWVQHSVTVPGDTTGTGWVAADSTNGVSMYVGICDIGSGSAYETSTADTWQAGNFKRKASDVKLISVLNATIYITGVQLEVGSVATPFETRSYGEELALCHRYYQTYQATAQEWIYLEGAGATSRWWQSYINTPMRAVPSATITSGFSGSMIGGTINSIALQSIQNNRASWRVTTSATFGSAYEVRHTDSFNGEKVLYSAEL